MASRKVLVSWLAFPFLFLAGTAIPGEAASGTDGHVNQIIGLEVQKGPHTTQVIVHAKATPTFTVFKLRNPDRLVVDLIHTDMAEELTGPRTVDDAQVDRIATTQFKQAGSKVSRLIIGLKEGVRFNARAQGNSVVVIVTGKNAPAEQAGKTPAASIPVKAVAKSAASVERPKAGPAKDFEVVASHGDKRSAKRVVIRRISTGDRDTVTVVTDRRVAAYEVLEVYEPFRLVMDIYGASIRQKRYTRKLKGKFVDRLRVAKHDDKVRLVLDFSEGRRQPYEIERLKRGLRIRFVERAGRVAAKVTKAAKAEPTARLMDLTFRQDDDLARVVLDIEGQALPKVVHSDARSTVLEIPGCSMPAILERTLDTSEFGGAIRSLSAYRIQDQGSIKVVAVTSEQVSNRFERRDGKLHWVFESPPPSPPRAGGGTGGEGTAAGGGEWGEYTYAPDQVAGYAVRRPEFADDSGGGKKSRRKKFRGRRISLDFKDADIHNILRLISEVAKLNIITSDDVKGKITITMRNVPWDQALDIILKTKKLGKVRHGNILRIAPMEELAKEQDLAAKARENRKIMEPLRVRIIAVNFASAGDVMPQVKELLSERGTVTVDSRTNVLIVKDVLENLVKAEGLVRSLDTETPQVLIEARIVEANTQYIREVGIQWGGGLNFMSSRGNPTGLPFPHDMSISGGADDAMGSTVGTADPGQYAINLPAAVGAGSGGALGFIFGSAGGSAQLNLRLTALENRGAVKIVTAPKITTLDNKKAKISQGVSIPISVVSAAGVNTMFVEARLELEVTPHITQEGSVLLEIKVRKNEPDFSRTGAKGDPTILKKEAETQVLVRDGDTTVIGGIYTRKTSDTISGIPILSQIPILGWFFRNTKYNDERTELLIFITPRIVNRLQATVSQR